MKHLLAVLSILLSLPFQISAQTNPEFDSHFLDSTMRIDYFHAGDAEREFISIDQIYVEGPWAGSRTNPISPFDNGRYFIKIRDLESGELNARRA